MSISLYDASVPVFKQLLQALSDVLAKGEMDASSRKFDPEILLQARLYPDMFPLLKQVQVAADFARGACARLAGEAVPTLPAEQNNFQELTTLIKDSIAFLDSISPAQINGQESREIVLRPGTPKERRLPASAYLLHYALPQFFFHVTTSYAILRSNGVAVGKKDFMGAW